MAGIASRFPLQFLAHSKSLIQHIPFLRPKRVQDNTVGGYASRFPLQIQTLSVLSQHLPSKFLTLYLGVIPISNKIIEIKLIFLQLFLLE